MPKRKEVFDFEKELQRALYLKTYSCLIDIFDAEKNKKRYYPPLKDEPYLSLLKIMGLVEGENSIYKVSKKGKAYIEYMVLNK